MRIPSPAVRVAVAAVLAACSHPAPSTTSAPQAAPSEAQAAPGQVDLTGDWAVQFIQQGQSPSGGTMRLVPAGGAYRGNLQLDIASQTYSVRNAQVQGNHVTIILDTPDGDARIEGILRTPAVFEGLYTSRNQNGRFTMNRR